MKAQGSPIVKYGLIALVVLAAIFAFTRMGGGGASEELGETPKPRADGEILPPLEDKYIIGKSQHSPKGTPAKN
jgi:hypothetical protein